MKIIRKKKVKQVRVRLTAEEYKVVARVAKNLDVSASEATRGLLILGMSFYNHGKPRA